MDIENTELSWDELNDPRPDETEFDAIVGTALNRRGFMGGVLAFGSGATAMGTGTLLSTTAAEAATGRFAFDANPSLAFDGPIRPSGHVGIRVLGLPEPWQANPVLPVHGREHIAQIRDMCSFLDDLGQVLGAHE